MKIFLKMKASAQHILETIQHKNWEEGVIGRKNTGIQMEF